MYYNQTSLPVNDKYQPHKYSEAEEELRPMMIKALLNPDKIEDIYQCGERVLIYLEKYETIAFNISNLVTFGIHASWFKDNVVVFGFKDDSGEHRLHFTKCSQEMFDAFLKTNSECAAIKQYLLEKIL